MSFCFVLKPDFFTGKNFHLRQEEFGICGQCWVPVLGSGLSRKTPLRAPPQEVSLKEALMERAALVHSLIYGSDTI